MERPDSLNSLVRHNIKYSVSILLFISFVLLSSLIPGGPIETRRFAHIDPVILGSFNTFLTSLAMVSVLLIYFILNNMKWAYIVSFVCGVLYFLVYALDLAAIFPVSPDLMPKALFTIEVLGITVSLLLMYFSIQGVSKSGNIDTRQPSITHLCGYKGGIKLFAVIASALVIVGIGIILFATKSAMGN